MAFSLAAAVSARASCTNRSEALSTTMHAITIPARASPVAKEIDERTASRITNGLRRMIRRRINQPRLRSCATSFGPPVRSRSSASACVRPSGAVCNEPSSASPSFPAASRTAGETRMLWFFAFAAIGDASGDGGATAGRTSAGPPFSAGFSTARFVSGAVIVSLGCARTNFRSSEHMDGYGHFDRIRVTAPIER